MRGEKIKSILIRFSRDQSGATAIEYGLIAAFIFVAIVTGVQAVGSGTADNIDNLVTEWEAAEAEQAS